MANYFDQFLTYINNGKNFHKLYLFLVIFLCAVKLPTLLTADIQPWDEGMYATRVLSIYDNADVWDQSMHSVGKFYSGSHPPLLIWIGYAFTLVFGTSAPVFKMIPFLFALGSVFLIMKIGAGLYDNKTGFIAALIFSGNLIFNVFSKRFQFDIPYTFFILLAFYFVVLYIKKPDNKYIIYAGITFGLCLMVKILVGIYIPIIIFGFYLLQRNKTPLTFKNIFVLTLIGICIALPWHLYMIMTYGQEFIHYFLGFHILDRAFVGVEENVKNSGVFYHINYYLSIIPFAIIVFFSLIKDIGNYKSLDWRKIFLWVWFLVGLVIISSFKTKLEIYVLLILVPGCLIIPEYLFSLKKGFTREKFLLLSAVFLNILWFASYDFRPAIKGYIAGSNKIMVLLMLVGCVILLSFTAFYLAKKINVSNTLTGMIMLFFVGANIYFLVHPPEWDYVFNLSPVREEIVASGKKKIFYVGSDFRHNPQFSFYFDGLDLGWDNKKYSYEFIDTKDGFDIVKSTLDALPYGEYNIIVEKDNINRSGYPDSENFIPEDIKLVKKTVGYELYQN
jgi:4-amino-4-deoxy-L-arabinose transferase-like glycosyltransferase